MAEKERLPNKERRAQARDERKLKEAEAAKKQRVSRIRSALVVVLILAVAVYGIVLAFSGGTESIAEPIVVDIESVVQGSQDASCEQLVVPADFDRTHYTPGSAPEGDALYTDVRPNAGGPHFETTYPLSEDGFTGAVDERAVTHNLEHGAVQVWYDADQLDGEAVDEISAWAAKLNTSGFLQQRSSASIFVAPYEGGFEDGKTIALRSWGFATNCDSFDENVLNSFVIDHYGNHGSAPEGSGSPFPEDLLVYDTTSLPTDPAASPSDGATTGSEPAASDPASSDPASSAPGSEAPTPSETGS